MAQAFKIRIYKDKPLFIYGARSLLPCWTVLGCTNIPNSFWLSDQLISMVRYSQVVTSVMRVRSDTFSDPIFQKGLQNQPSSQIISILGCFTQLCQLVAKYKKWTFKVNFLCQKLSKSFSFFFIEQYQIRNTFFYCHLLIKPIFDFFFLLK